MKISLIQPSRNNLKYLKWSYDSIRKNQGNHEVEICVADDASTDETWAWCQERMEADPHFKAIQNDTGERLGHTILYDRLINEVATSDICMIYHADMYLCPDALDAIEEEMKEKTIVSLTRIEPPLHPDGPEKILRNFGVEPEEFDEEGLLEFLDSRVPVESTTEGIFAPWAFWKSDFQEIGGHDPLYAPQSKEDSDIFNRFLLNGIQFVQTWHGCVYHMTCRGSRRNTLDKAVNIYQDSPEWLAQNQRSTRNFIRKWGHFVMHDKYMKPVVPNKYRTEIRILDCTPALLKELEPWADHIYTDLDQQAIDQYIAEEQPNTKYHLPDKINSEAFFDSDIIVHVEGNSFSKQDFIYIQQLSQILDDSGKVGDFKLGNIDLVVNRLNTYTEELIHL